MFNWLHFLTYAVVTAITPGPNNLLSMQNGGRLGFRRALPFNLGVFVGFSVVMALCTLLCRLLTTLIPKIQFPMMVAGAAYLLYLAWKTFRSSGPAEAGNPAHSGFWPAVALQFINPKAYLYGIVSAELYILPAYPDQSLVQLGFTLLLAFIAFLCTLCWSAFGSAFRFLFIHHAKATNTVMALLLVYCAVSLFL